MSANYTGHSASFVNKGLEYKAQDKDEGLEYQRKAKVKDDHRRQTSYT